MNTNTVIDEKLSTKDNSFCRYEVDEAFRRLEQAIREYDRSAVLYDLNDGYDRMISRMRLQDDFAKLRKQAGEFMEELTKHTI